MHSHGNAERDSGQPGLIVEAADGRLTQRAEWDIHHLIRARASVDKRPTGRLGVGLAALFGDILVLIVSGLILWRLMPEGIDPSHSTTSSIAVIAAYVLLLGLLAAYRTETAREPIFQGVAAATIWIASTAVTIGLLYAGGVLDDGRVLLFVMLCLPAGSFSLLALRALMRPLVKMIRDGGGLATQVVVVGRGPLLRVVSSAAALAQARGDIAAIGMIELPPGENPCAELIPRLQSIMPDVVVLAVDWDDRSLLQAGALAARSLPLDLLVPAIIMPPGTEATLRLGDQPMVRLWSRPLSGLRGWAKRAEDLSIGMAGLLVAMPIMLLVAILVRLDSPGPVLIRQRRFGYGNRPILIWKFRTMHWEQSDLSGAQAAVRYDPRVTRIGRFLRSTSLDELPQLFNVLRGDMSLVGPRPHPVEMRVGDAYYHDAVPGYAARHRMKPGITGLAQINGCRGLVDTIEKAQQRLDYDLYYIENWSISVDLVILMRTTYKGFLNGGSF